MVLIVTVLLNIVSLHSCFSYWFVIDVFNCVFVADCYHCVYVDFILTFIIVCPYFLLMICIIDLSTVFIAKGHGTIVTRDRPGGMREAIK